MHNHATRGNEGQERRRARPRRGGYLAAALIGVALLAAACSGSPSSGATSASTGSSGKASALAYAQCMRAHGVKSFPDPNAQGQIALTGGHGVDPSSPQFHAANNACKSLMPPAAVGAAGQAQAKAANLKYAQCMRAHRIADFPDPNSQGALQIQVKPGSDLDPHNPRFQAANTACQHLLPGGGRPGGGRPVTGGGGGA